ncbi:MAG: hypothetical protein V7K98_06160 [Nostoc sp.]|uniref:hypothetical protein n=1 Tax=Nostoc sp. TaxID=1180 RepID=UPI002FF789EE
MKLFTTLIATAVSVAAVAISAPAHALVFTQWNFNNSDLTPNIGNGTASLVGGTTATFAGGAGSTDLSTPTNMAWITASYPIQGGTFDKIAGVQFASSTAGYQNIIVSWDQRNSGTASKYAQFQYSTNGSTFVDFGAPSITGGNGSFLSYSVDLSSITAVNNNSSFAFRLVSAFDPSTPTLYSGTGGGYTSGGTRRFDMVTANGNAIAVPFDTPGGATIPTVGSLVALGAMIKVRKTIASKIANPVTSAVS